MKYLKIYFNRFICISMAILTLFLSLSFNVLESKAVSLGIESAVTFLELLGFSSHFVNTGHHVLTLDEQKVLLNEMFPDEVALDDAVIKGNVYTDYQELVDLARDITQAQYDLFIGKVSKGVAITSQLVDYISNYYIDFTNVMNQGSLVYDGTVPNYGYCYFPMVSDTVGLFRTLPITHDAGVTYPGRLCIYIDYNNNMNDKNRNLHDNSVDKLIPENNLVFTFVGDSAYTLSTPGFGNLGSFVPTYVNDTSGSYQCINVFKRTTGPLVNFPFLILDINQYNVFNTNLPAFGSLQECADYVINADDSKALNLCSEDFLNATKVKSVFNPLIDKVVDGSIISNAVAIVDTAIATKTGEIDEADEDEKSRIFTGIWHDAIDDVLPDVVTKTDAVTVPVVVDPTIPVETSVPEAITKGFTADLTQLFPFCLPFDLFRTINVLKSEAIAPHWKLPITVESIDFSYTIDINFNKFETLASIFRSFQVVLFIIALITLTRKIIGA